MVCHDGDWERLIADDGRVSWRICNRALHETLLLTRLRPDEKYPQALRDLAGLTRM